MKKLLPFVAILVWRVISTDVGKTVKSQERVDLSKLGAMLNSFLPGLSTIVPLGHWWPQDLEFFCGAEISVSLLCNLCVKLQQIMNGKDGENQIDDIIL